MNNKEMEEQISYWKHNPDKFVEFVIRRKLRLHEKIWIKLSSKIRH